MTLQVRLRHALGERLLDLADRPVEQPLVVGRAGSADVKIPSVSVAADHCALFVHEGQWVLQDTSGGATFVNGHPMEGPTPLCIGDVITLGTDAAPAVIEIDPAGAALGRTGQPAQTPAAAPASRQRAGTVAARGAGASYAGAVSAPPPPPAPAAWPADANAGDDPFASWQSPAAGGSDGTSPAATRRRPAKKSSDAPLIIGIAACVLIVGFAGWFAYHQTHLPVAAPTPVQSSTDDSDSAHPKSIFNDGPERPAKHAAPAPAPKRTAKARDTDSDSSETPKLNPPQAHDDTPPPSADNDEKDVKDPHKNDEGWSEIEGAHYATDFGTAILKFEDYKRQHPGMNTREIDAFTSEALDRLWWKRIAQLCNHRDDLKKQIKAKTKDIHDEPSASFKKTLTEEKNALEADLTKTLERLTGDMGYAGDVIPDTTNKPMIDKLTAERDAEKYGAWKLRTLNFIRSHHGATPWDGES